MRHVPWPSGASSALVSRSRAMPVGDRRSWPFPRFFAVGDGSFAAFGRDAGLNTGVPGLSRAPSRLGMGVSRPLAAMPV